MTEKRQRGRPKGSKKVSSDGTKPEPKKRGRKRKNPVEKENKKENSIMDMFSSKSTVETLDEHVVLHLPIKAPELISATKTKKQSSLLDYNPVLSDPNPYSTHNNYAITKANEEMMCVKCRNSMVKCDKCKQLYKMNESLKERIERRRLEDDITLDICDEDDSLLNKKIIDHPLKHMEGLRYDPNINLDEKMKDLDLECYNEEHSKLKITDKLNTDTDLLEEFENLKKKYDDLKQDIEASKPAYITYQPGDLDVTFKEIKIMSSCPQLEDWKDKTKICCWWDCHPFDTTALPLPISYDLRKKIFVTEGVFCSFNCMLSYAKQKNRMDLIYYFYMRSTGEGYDSYKKIKAAPPRESLNMFGGYKSITKFRENNTQNDTDYLLIIPPFTIETNKISETKSFQTNNTKKYTAKKTYKLQRSKPLPHLKNSLTFFNKS